jgi:hypothetical protein
MSIVATPISLAAVAGRWNMQARAEATDSLLVRYVLDTKADTSGWTLTMADRPPTPIRVVAVEGDSIRIAAGPYPSVLRRGVSVSTAGVLRLRDGMLVGTSVATYTGAGVDSVLRIRVEGMRAP